MPENSTITIPRLEIGGVDIPVETAQHILHFFGDDGLGVKPDVFAATSIDLLVHSDRATKKFFSQVFPAYAAALSIAYTTDGLQALRVFVQEATR